MNVSLHPARTLPRDLVDAWIALQRSEPTLDHPLFHPAWVEAVAAVRDDVFVAVLQEAGEPAAFLPFERRGRQGRSVAACMSDLHGLIARPQTQCDLPELLRRSGLSVWHFDHLPVEQSWFTPYHYHLEEAAAVDLSNGLESYWGDRRAACGSWFSQMRRKENKLRREVGRPRFVWHTTDPTALEALTQWKRAQLQASNQLDVFSLPWFPPLLRSLCDHQLPSFAGVLSALYAGEELVAVHAGISNERVLSSWIPAYHPAYARYSPGALLHLEMIRAAAERGVERIELGRGVNPLKRALGSTAVQLAIGAVDLSPARRWRRARLLHLREVVRASPLGDVSKHTYRRVRNWIASRSANVAVK